MFECLVSRLVHQEGKDTSDTSSISESVSSTNCFDELDDILFGVSTRHQWHQLISQIEATNSVNKRGGSQSNKSKKKAWNKADMADQLVSNGKTQVTHSP